MAYSTAIDKHPHGPKQQGNPMTQQQQQPRPKAVPHPNAETQFYWDKVRRTSSGFSAATTAASPTSTRASSAPTASARNVEWFQTSGKGKLHTYMINHRPPPAFEDDAPYAIAIVELDEGVRMMTNILGIENTPENLVLDMPLEWSSRISRKMHRSRLGARSRRVARYLEPAGWRERERLTRRTILSIRYKAAVVGAAETTEHRRHP